MIPVISEDRQAEFLVQVIHSLVMDRGGEVSVPFRSMPSFSFTFRVDAESEIITVTCHYGKSEVN